MKIEIGESLVYSFLRHEKNCLVTQTNWKTSGNWKVLENTQDMVKYEFDKITSHHEFANIFRGQKLEQVIKQAEIDILGISNNKVYAYEVAFHESGLNYGSRIETRNRVIKKLLRGYLTLRQYFPKYKYEIVFCSPKVNSATENFLHDYFELLKTEFSDESTSFLYFANEDFYTQILDRVIDTTKAEADSSELFVRAVKLLNLGDRMNNKTIVKSVPVVRRAKPATVNSQIDYPDNLFEVIHIRGVDIEVPPDQGRVFQKYVQKAMRKLLNQNLLTNIEITYLLNLHDSKEKFDLNFPLLVKELNADNYDR